VLSAGSYLVGMGGLSVPPAKERLAGFPLMKQDNHFLEEDSGPHPHLSPYLPPQKSGHCRLAYWYSVSSTLRVFCCWKLLKIDDFVFPILF
jgi:hypothetical protein